MDGPPRAFWQIWNMSFGFLGIQFGWGLQMAYMSAIYEYLQARTDELSILWLAAPLIWIDRAADHRPPPRPHLGRRRPYFASLVRRNVRTLPRATQVLTSGTLR
jgi:maltose/moltooligosaccharide transporter